MPAGPFVEAVKRVSLVAERGSAVRLVFGSGGVAIEAGTQGRARAREMVPAEFTGTEPEIAFSPHFLLDGITAAGAAAPSDADPGGTGDAERKEHADPPDRSSAFIRLEFTSATKPAVITGVRGRSAPGEGRRSRPAMPGNPAHLASGTWWCPCGRPPSVERGGVYQPPDPNGGWPPYPYPYPRCENQAAATSQAAMTTIMMASAAYRAGKHGLDWLGQAGLALR